MVVAFTVSPHVSWRIARHPGFSEPGRDNTASDAARDYSEYVHGIDRAIEECRVAFGENPGNARVRAAYSGASIDRRRAMDHLASGGGQ